MIPTSPGQGAVGVGVLGRGVLTQLVLSGCPSEIRLLATSDHLDGFRPPIAIQRPDVLVIEFAALGPEPSATLVHLLDLSGAHTAIVLADPGPPCELGPLASARVRFLDQPVTTDELLQALLAVARGAGADAAFGPENEGAVPRRFDDTALQRLAEIATTVECACPNHLARIVSSLVRFEAYTARCEADSSADEEMHAALRVEVARARGVLEAALARVIEHDGIELGTADSERE